MKFGIGRATKEFLAYLDITDEQFWAIIDRYRLSHIWKREGGSRRLRKAVYDELGCSKELPGYIASLARLKSG